MNTIPFSRINLRPWSPDNSTILDYTRNDIMDLNTKEIMLNHAYKYHKVHNPIWPKETKEFYLVPFASIVELEKYKLRQANFSALYLPSIIELWSNDNLPQILKSSEKGIVVIAWDFNFSNFTPAGRVLAVDLSMGFPTFVLWKNMGCGYGFNPGYYFLAESED